MQTHIKIGTRNSALALWQAHWVGKRLEEFGMSYELIAILSKGDQILDRSLSKIGSKGVFTEELEEMLRNGEIHIAQHSAKDLPSHLPNDLELIAFTAREKAHDVLLSLDPDFDLEQSSSKTIGSSSTRRRAIMQAKYPQHNLVEMRGNLQTRLEKLKNGTCDAMLLAYAGVHRMEMEQYIVKHFPIDQFTPAVGQGSVAIQTSVNLEIVLKEKIRLACNDLETEECILAERSLLFELEGGCSVPVYGHAWKEGKEIHLKAGVLSLDGGQHIESAMIGQNSIELGQKVAKDLISKGAKEILREIKSNSNE
ncbi:hydroxymethylbilane synthase [Sandaracinomonas limnophila]|uniref:Hydroxymethylbilane synthase n=1 Tax=Sandaracinomonas limnophila TaxID=1862386 RepID=A0A437PMK1_9BACT|nr:hydroxymethylbilane synthase [Sandaracinomonas limnophila]RVU23518.1 hydroxymethylbilane synthase [Sandaracinomonas limnophila]